MIFNRISTLICAAFLLGSGVVFGQADTVQVRGDTEANYLTFSGNRTAWPATPSVGEIFYNSSLKEVRYWDGVNWAAIGGAGASTSKSIAGRVVAASNTPGGSGRADYVCTGTNDQAVINNALNDLVAVDGDGDDRGGTVYLLEGDYNISSPIIIPSSNISLIGSGNKTVLNLISGDTVISVSNKNGITISRLCIDGNNRAPANYGIYFSAVRDSCIERVYVLNLRGRCVLLRNGSCFNRISGCRFVRSDDNGAYAIRLQDYENCDYNMIFNNTSEGGLYSSSIFFAAEHCILSENRISGPDHGIYVDNRSHAIIVNNDIRNARTGIYTAGTRYNVICGNEISDSSEAGIKTNGSSYNVIGGNTLFSNAFGLDIMGLSGSNVISSNVIYGDDSTSAGAYSLRLGETDPSYPAVSNLVLGNLFHSSVSATGDTYGILIPNNSLYSDNSLGNYLSANLISGSRYEIKIKDDRATSYTDKTKLTLEPIELTFPGSSGTIDFRQQSSYIRVNSTGVATLNLTLGKGLGMGGIIVIENISAAGREIRLADSGLGPVNVPNAQKILGRGDTITLLWNGYHWLQIMYSDNG